MYKKQTKQDYNVLNSVSASHKTRLYGVEQCINKTRNKIIRCWTAYWYHTKQDYKALNSVSASHKTRL